MLARRSLQRACAALALGAALVRPAAPLASAQPNAPSARRENGAGSRQEYAITLNIGEQHVLPAEGVKSYSEGTPGIIDVRLTGDASRFVVVGMKGGVGTLLFLMADGSERNYRVTVLDPNQDAAGPAPASPTAVKPQANIRLDLYFVQLDRSYTHSIGMNVPTVWGAGQFTYAYDLPARQLVSNSAIVGTELLPQLELAQTSGWAKVSRHVAVITTNGTQANFTSGGQYNVQVVQGLTASVSSIKFGNELGVLPRYDDETGRIELQITADVSDLTSTGANLPGRTSSTLTTVVNLALGESLAVAGLTSKTSEKQHNGLPWLSQIPLIGLLFGKQNARARDTDNVVFIVPSVVEPLRRARAKEFLREAVRRYDEYDGDNDEFDHSMLPSLEQTERKASTGTPQ